MLVKAHYTGELIKRRRKDLDLTQKRLGQLLGFMHGQYIANVERGDAPFPTRKILELSVHLQITPAVIQEALIKDYARSLEAEVNKRIDLA